MNKDIDTIAEKYISRESHKGSVNRIRVLLKEDINKLIDNAMLEFTKQLYNASGVPTASNDWVSDVDRLVISKMTEIEARIVEGQSKKNGAGVRT